MNETNIIGAIGALVVIASFIRLHVRRNKFLKNLKVGDKIIVDIDHRSILVTIDRMYDDDCEVKIVYNYGQCYYGVASKRNIYEPTNLN